MENKDILLTGRTVSTDYSPSGSVIGAAVTYPPQIRDRVSNILSLKGDKKAPNPHKYDSYLSSAFSGSIDTYHTNGNYGPLYHSATLSGVVGTFLENRLDLPAFNVDLQYNQAVAKLYDKVRGSLDLSIAVAEAHETKRLLNVIKQIEDLTRELPSKGKGFDWRKPIRVLGGRWLQWHLAIRPLIADVYGSIDEFYRHKVPELLTIKVKRYERFPQTFVCSKLYANDPTTLAQVSGIQGVAFHLRFTDNGGFDLNRWTSLNPVSIAWETLPLSFVFDYFVNVSGFLRSLESSLATQSLFVDGYWSKLYAIDARAIESGPRARSSFSGGDTGSYLLYSSQANFRRVSFERSLLTGMPTPRLPSFVLPTSWQKLVTMASLLAVRLK